MERERRKENVGLRALKKYEGGKSVCLPKQGKKGIKRNGERRKD